MRQHSGIGVLDKAMGVLQAAAERPCNLAELCERTAAEATCGLADLSDPLLDTLAQRHTTRERPLFVS